MITEGAAYLSELMKQSGIACDQYISITPEKEFQISHFCQREFVPYVLRGCRDMEQAFCNWMDRDQLFAREVQKQCRENRYFSVINDGKSGIDELAAKVAAHFGLSEQDRGG